MDVVQESIYQGFVKIRSLRRPEYFVTWMNKIVITNALKFIKKKSCFEPYEEQVGQSSSQGITLDEKIDLYCALKKLKRKERDAIVLKYFYDKPIAEIALILKTPENSVKTILRRAKEHLRKILKDSLKQEISFPISCYKIPNSHKPLFYAACESFVMYADFTYLFISIHKILF